jgi:hypothetical protein
MAGQLAQLHSRSCRLLHWLAAGDNRALLPQRGSMGDWDMLEQSVGLLLAAVDDLELGPRDSSLQGPARWVCLARKQLQLWRCCLQMAPVWLKTVLGHSAHGVRRS